jgi:hypothetical protein
MQNVAGDMRILCIKAQPQCREIGQMNRKRITDHQADGHDMPMLQMVFIVVHEL